eukprot:s374_g33.t1
MPLPLVLLTLLGAAVGLGDMPPVPDLIEIAEDSVHGVLSPPTVEEPKVWLPTIAQINAMTDEERTARFHWFLFVFAQIKLVGLSFVVTVSLSFTASIWSLQTGRLSKKVGLDWEVYLFLFCCGCLSLLIQSVVAVAWLKAGARFDTTAFAVASMSILPVFSDQFDTLKDIIFGALCYQSEQYAIQLLGVLSWLYLLAFHAWFFLLAGSNPIKGTPGANCFSELATSHLSVLLTAPKVDGESSAGFWEGTILPTLYKQLTPSKRQYLLIENLPQAVLSILFLCFEGGPSKRQYLLIENLPQAVLSILFLCFEGGSIFVVILNLAVPAVQIGLTLILFQPVRAAAAPALSKALNRAVSNGNAIAAKTIWEEAEVGEDIQLFQRMLPRLRFVLDFMERSGFKELDKLSEVELEVWRRFAEMLTFEEAKCDLNDQKILVLQSFKHELDKLSKGVLKVCLDIAKMLVLKKDLANWNLESKTIGNSGAKVVAQALKHTATRALILAYNAIGDDGAQAPLRRESPGESGRVHESPQESGRDGEKFHQNLERCGVLCQSGES